MRNAFILCTSTSVSGRSLSAVPCVQCCQMPICLFVAAGFWLHLFRTKYVACTSIIINHSPPRSQDNIQLLACRSQVVSVIARLQIRGQSLLGPESMFCDVCMCV